ncbi:MULTISPECIES: hypothetical protein [Pacificibacter]|uniref:hypothetical protein n=1 Tax=Pacificibacter TaxID=1042323 RepID=UPI001C09D277|nr:MULTISPECIES: hypothetical protein [Pacificibacter]MBU2937002.1 hypothetical protein [Pacificibacter marinus]MDO6617178.1 hypothetical protein [Pacificibacter sp. 1_MG-2023]
MTRFNRMPPAQQAGILCNDPQFQKFAAIRSGMPDTKFCASAAAQYLRDTCKIDSRRELNTDTAAQSNFAALRTTFDAWAGRVASPIH